MDIKREIVPKKNGSTTIINKGFASTTNNNPNIDTQNFSVVNLVANNINTNSIYSIDAEFENLGANDANITDLTLGNIHGNVTTDCDITCLSSEPNTFDKTIDLEQVNVKLGSHNTFHSLTGDETSELYANNITTDYLTVLRSAHFFELIIDKIKASGGSVLFSAADGFSIDKVVEENDYYILFWRACSEVAEGDDGDTLSETGQVLTENVSINMWKQWDQALCQTFNLSNGAGTYQDVSNTYWWRVVQSVSNEPEIQTIDGEKYYCHWIKVYKSGNYVAQNSDEPEVGNQVAMLGYRYDQLQNPSSDDIARASAIMISAYQTIDTGVKPPSYVQYQDITDFNLGTHRKTYIDATGAHIVGNLEAGTTVDPNIQLPITFEQWNFVGTPVIIKNENETYTPATFALKILYTSQTQSILYNSIPPGTSLYVNHVQSNSTTIIASDYMDIQLIDNTNNNVLCATILTANDVDLLANVSDGVDGDFYEFIYKKVDNDIDIGRNDLPASLEKKFYDYTTQEKRGWNQIVPLYNPDMENMWMSERFVKYTVLPYDPSIVTSPVIMADKTDAIFQADPNTTEQVSIRITGHLLTNNVTVTLTDTNNVFSLSSNSLDYDDVNGNGVMLVVTFSPTTTGDYDGTITLSSNGANNVVIDISGICSSDDLASNNYLNIKKSASISTVGWDPTKINDIYKYTEKPEEGKAWLVMSVYGAFSSIHESYTQNWINTDVTFDSSTYITDGAWQPITGDVFLGSDYYFTNTTPKSVGAEALLSSTGSSVTFFVNNVTNVKLYGYNRTWTGTAQHPMSITVYECTVSGGTVTPSSEYTAQASSNNKNADVNLEIANLDPTKVYEVVCKEERGTMHEVAFCTPITKNSDTAYQDERYVITTWGDWSNPLRVNGLNGENGADGDGVEFIYCRTRSNIQPPLMQLEEDVQDPTSPNIFIDPNGQIGAWIERIVSEQITHYQYRENYLPPSYEDNQYFTTIWTDSPQGVDDTWVYEWVAQRTYDGSTRKWNLFTEPVVWAKYGKDGLNGVDGQNGADGADGSNGEFWFLSPIKNDFSVRINNATNYENITGRLNTDLAFGIVHVSGDNAEWVSAAEMTNYQMKLITDNTTDGGQRNNQTVTYANQTLALDGVTIPVLTYSNNNYLTYTANTQSGNYIDYYYLYENQLTNRMPTKMTVVLYFGNTQVYTYTIPLIFKPDHLFSVTEDALNSIYQGLSGDVSGIYTTGFSSIRQQWNSINLAVNNMTKFANGEFPINNEYQQYVYYCTTSADAPTKPSGNVTTNTQVYNQWTTYNMEATSTYKYVWYSLRTKPTNSPTHSTDSWSAWSDSALLQTYGSSRGYPLRSYVDIEANKIKLAVESELGDTGIDITNHEINLQADKVTFSNSSGTVNDKISIDPTTGTLNAEDVNISGTINANAGYFGTEDRVFNMMLNADDVSFNLTGAKEVKYNPNTGLPVYPYQKWSASTMDDYKFIDISCNTWNSASDDRCTLDPNITIKKPYPGYNETIDDMNNKIIIRGDRIEFWRRVNGVDSLLAVYSTNSLIIDGADTIRFGANFVDIRNYQNDATARQWGLVKGDIYHTNGTLKIVQ